MPRKRRVTTGVTIKGIDPVKLLPEPTEPRGEPNGEGDATLPTEPPRWGIGPDGKPRKERSKSVLSDLPKALENLTSDTFTMFRKILRFDVDRVSDARLRSMVTTGGIVLGGKIRVDEGALRVKHNNDVLDRLERILREARKTVPAD